MPAVCDTTRSDTRDIRPVKTKILFFRNQSTQILIIMSSEHISPRCASSVHRHHVDVGGRSNKKKKPINIDGRVRAYFNRTNLDLILIGLFLAAYSYHAQASEVAATEGHGGTTSLAEGAAPENSTGHDAYTESNTEFAHEEAHDSSHAAVHAVLFPWFAQIIGIFVYYFLSRYAHALPYTAVMFVMGFSMGYSIVHHKNMETTLKESLITWMDMPGQLILLVFLPGLLYIDSYHIDGKFDQ
jgi:F0F1-type ATP synthase assembly protein I